MFKGPRCSCSLSPWFRRILAWQQVIYAETALPVWLRDSLVNNLHLIAETGMWAQAKPPSDVTDKTGRAWGRLDLWPF